MKPCAFLHIHLIAAFYVSCRSWRLGWSRRI